MSPYLRLVVPVLFFCFSDSVRAQKKGWDYLCENNFVEARTAFDAELRHDAHDEPALIGQLFLAETVRDHERYEQAVNQLLLTNWTPEYVWLFQRLFDGTPEEALRRSADSRQCLTEWSLQQADSLFKYRHFAESNSLRRATLPDWNWSICGPFTNIDGSGFAETTPVETRAFRLLDTFTNESGLQFGWLRTEHRQPGSPVDFTRLAPPAQLATWYANTFIEVPDERPVRLCITRSEPMKIWLDGQLLFDRSKPELSNEWDTEALLFRLPAGRHRLLVKISSFPPEYTDSRLQLEFNDRDNNGDRDYDPDYEGMSDNRPPAWQSTARFALRCTDPATGKPFADIRSAYEGPENPARNAWNPVQEEHRYLRSLEEARQLYPTEWWRLYLIAKAFAKYGLWEDGEAYFAREWHQFPESAYVRFLLAKFYDINDKSERAEALLSGMDTSSAPTYAEHFIRLSKINKDRNEKDYLDKLTRMLELSPTNWYLLRHYLGFLKDKGREEQVKTFVHRFLEQHDSDKWKNRLAEYLEEESYKPESYKPETDSERQKNFRQAKKNLKTVFRLSDYAQLIRYYKQSEKTADVLATYDEVLEIAPYLLVYAQQRVAYLFESGRPEEALISLTELLEILPYDAALCELAGDIYIEKKEDKQALYWYHRADMLKGRNAFDLAGKIERLENQADYGSWFEPVNLMDVAKQQARDTSFSGEDAVIPLFAQQVTYNTRKRNFQISGKCIISIRTEAGANRWTEADLSLLGSITSARILKKDGSVTSPELGYGGTAVFKNLQAGDAILLEGISERGMPEEFSGEYLDLRFFSWPSPVLRATFEVLLPRDTPFFLACNRLEEHYSERDSANLRLRRWEWHRIERFEQEEAMPDNIDATAWMMYGSAPDWSRVVQWYQRKTYCRTEPNYEVRQYAESVLKPGMSEAQIVETLHTFITRDINYSYVSFLNSNYVPKKAGATLSAKVGDCKDVATLMITMLREQGIPAWYTLVSTHNFSNREPRPTPFVFNHAIVAWQSADGRLHFDDLTTDYFPNGVLPFSDSEAWGLVIRDGETRLRRLPNHALDPDVTRVDIQADATVDAMGNILLDTRVTRHGVAAGNWREIMSRSTPEDRLKQLTEYYGGGTLTHLSIESTHFENLDSINAPLRSGTRLQAFHQMDKVAGLHILPLPIPLSTPMQKSLLAAVRYNDLDLDALLEISPVRETVTLHIPPGFRLAEIPENRFLETGFGRYSLSFTLVDEGLRIHREVTFARRFIQHTDFQAFKQFYLDMLESDDSLLALRKK